MTIRIATPIRAAVLLTLAQSILASSSYAHDRHRGVILEETVTLKHIYWRDPPSPEMLGRPFEMMGHNGQTVTNASYLGKRLLVSFGFTRCRESCPVGLENMTAALDALGADAEQVQPLFIDVSTEERDSAGLKQFVSNFHPKLVGHTGTRAQTFSAVRECKVCREYAMTNYSSRETKLRINPATYFCPVDPQGVTRAYLYHNLPLERMALTMGLHVGKQRASQ